jgi:hypothetical protein
MIKVSIIAMMKKALNLKKTLTNQESSSELEGEGLS